MAASSRPGTTVTVAGRTRPVESNGVTLIEAPTLDALANTIRHEIVLTQQAATKALKHALAAGDALLEARQRVKYGQWGRWLGEQGIDYKTASTYMRIAHFREALLPLGVSSLTEALKALREQGLVFMLQCGPEVTYEIKRLRAQGLTQAETATRLGISQGMVSNRERDPDQGSRRRGGGRSLTSPRGGITDHMIEGLAIWLCDGDPKCVNDLVRRRATEALRAAYTYRGAIGAE